MNLITPEFGLIFWQTLIFLLVLFVLGKFAWKPILGALKAREASIEEALQSAEKPGKKWPICRPVMKS
jgi:F-type H+-transporting ATPase subunit b